MVTREHKMATKSEKPTCGIVMPISEIDGCSEQHWGDVLAIFVEAIEVAGFEGELVSNADDVGIIQKRIIQNLYDNPIVVCDVSGKNSNVMFELGLRLAFDKPTIIVKDDQTAYSFDTSAIEHLEYPRDLRFNRIVDFKKRLSEKIKATHKKATEDPNYTTFLKHFGEFKVAKLDKKEVSGQEFIIEELRTMRNTLARMERSDRQYFVGENPADTFWGAPLKRKVEFVVPESFTDDIAKVIEQIEASKGVRDVDLRAIGDRYVIVVEFEPKADQHLRDMVIKECSKITEFYGKHKSARKSG